MCFCRSGHLRWNETRAARQRARTVSEMISKSQLIYRGSRMRGTLIAVATVAVLAGCSTYDSLTQRVAQSITPYRITVVQGNFVSQEAAAQMQVGMSRAQVKQLLGTPLLTDMFHADRWDYVFYFKRGSTNVVQQRDFVDPVRGRPRRQLVGRRRFAVQPRVAGRNRRRQVRQEEGRRAERGKRRNWRQRAGSR